MPYTFSITGAPGAGKTCLALAPHASLGETITQIAFDPVAASLSNIPPAWRERITVVQPGVSQGKREKGARWMQAVLDTAGTRHETDRIVVDALSHMAHTRYFDVISPKGGVPSDKYTEYHAPQAMVKAFLQHLGEANPHATIIVLTHAKERRNERHDVVGYLPDLVGSALVPTWASRFAATLALERRPAAKKGGQARHVLLLEKTRLWDWLEVRVPLGARLETAEVDCTVEGAGEFGALSDAWGVVLSALGEDGE